MQKKSYLLKNNITIIDSTLRDGSHAIRHQLTKNQISRYAYRLETVGIPILMVGHGNGLGASSIHLGISKLSDVEMIRAAKKELKKTKLGAFIIPGFGTIQKDIDPAIKAGISVLMVATHCTEANVSQEHIEYAKKKGLDVYGILMMSHMANAKTLFEQSRYMIESGARGIILMDSSGSYLPEEVFEKVQYLVKNLKSDVGFHAHNNLGLAVANSLAAVQAGAKIIDGTARGIGAGAGNCPLEVLVTILRKLGISTGVDIFRLMETADFVANKIMLKPQEIDSLTLTSGLSGVFSGFIPHVVQASNIYHIDPRNLLIELGKRGVVAGQEDMILHAAQKISKKNASS